MDDLFREKMNDFSPNPPEHIWTGIEKNLARRSFYLSLLNNWKTISAAILVLLLLTLGAWYFLPNEAEIAETPFPVNNKPELIISEKVEADSENPKKENESDIVRENLEKNTNSSEIRSEKNTNSAKNILEKDNETEIYEISLPAATDAKTTTQIDQLINSDKSEELAVSVVQSMQNINIDFYNLLDSTILSTETINALPTLKPNSPQKRGWKMGFYFSPEVFLNDFDSVRMLTTYSFNVEPVYYFNNSWFIRFGIGISSMSDRGFAKIDFMSNELMGTYDDVYDVTFDSINGKLEANYYTAQTEVWDSIRRISITEATNKYLYLQFPLLFGYTKKASHLNWSFYAGPAINFKVNEKTEMSIDNGKNSSIIDLENELPGRSPYFFQLWIGVGAEYKAGKNLSLTLEPNYRYSFSGMYASAPYKKGLSSFALRVGIIYKIK